VEVEVAVVAAVLLTEEILPVLEEVVRRVVAAAVRTCPTEEVVHPVVVLAVRRRPTDEVVHPVPVAAVRMCHTEEVVHPVVVVVAKALVHAVAELYEQKSIRLTEKFIRNETEI